MKRRLDTGLGVLVAAAGYYGLSLASAFWVGQRGPNDDVWSLLIGSVVCVGLGSMVGWRIGAARVASALMLAFILIGFAAGSDRYSWVPPFPADVVTLFLHGARSPLVVGPTVLICSVAVWHSTMSGCRPPPEMPTPTER